MLILGTHMSSARGLARLGREALAIGANSAQFFLRNPRGFRAKPPDEANFKDFDKLMRAHDFGPVIAHAPYTFNPCSPEARVRELALEMAADDLAKMEHLPGNYYNVHPGTHGGQKLEIALGQIATTVSKLLAEQPATIILLETMSGKGTEVGWKFEELAEIIARVEHKGRVGICFDACHLYSAGYDIVHDLDGVLSEFDRLVGLERLKAFHLNDSLNPFGSRKDRHAVIGQGHIGLEPVLRIINHPSLEGLVFITETPLEPADHLIEIKTLRESYCR